MPRFNPYELARAEPVVDTREFSDPAHPNAPFTLTLRAVNEAPFKLKVNARCTEYVTDYVLGRVRASATKPGELPLRNKPALVYTRTKSGRALIDLDEQTCRAIGILDMLQVPEQDDKGNMVTYSFDEWAAMSVLMPEAFIEAANWAAEMLNGGKPEDEEGLGSEDAGSENP